MRRLASVSPALMASPAVIYILTFLGAPLTSLIVLSFQTTQGWSIGNYTHALSSFVFVRSLIVSIALSLAVAFLCGCLGFPLARCIARSTGMGRRFMLLCVVLSFWSSFMAKTFGWLVMLERHGFVNWILMRLHLIDTPIPMLFSLGAVLCGMVHALIPIFVLAVLPVMDTIDPQMERAAQTLGAGPGGRFWQIYLPMAGPGVMSGFLLAFVSASSFFIVPELMGTPSQTMISQLIIVEVLQLLDWHFAATLSVLLITGVALGYLGVSLLGRRLFNTHARLGRNAFTSSGSTLLGRIGRVVDRLATLSPPMKHHGWASRILVALLMAYLLVPMLILFPISLTKSDFLGWPPHLLSLQWYQQILHSPVWAAAAMRSVRVAIASALLATVLGALAAMAIVRCRAAVAGPILSTMLLPLILPRISLAVALYQSFTPLGLVGSDIGLVLGHVLITLPYCVISLVAVFRLYDTQFEQAAATLGAPLRVRCFRVMLPLLRPGLVAAFLLAFAISFDELTIALFVSGGIRTTLPKLMWDNAVLAVDPTLAAASSLLLLLLGGIVILATGFSARRDRAKDLAIPH